MKLVPLQIRDSKKNFRFIDGNGNPLCGGRVYVYVQGTLRPAAVYMDAEGVTREAFPVILDSRGEADIFVSHGVRPDITIADAFGRIVYREYVDQV